MSRCVERSGRFRPAGEESGTPGSPVHLRDTRREPAGPGRRPRVALRSTSLPLEAPGLGADDAFVGAGEHWPNRAVHGPTDVVWAEALEGRPKRQDPASIHETGPCLCGRQVGAGGGSAPTSRSGGLGLDLGTVTSALPKFRATVAVRIAVVYRQPRWPVRGPTVDGRTRAAEQRPAALARPRGCAPSAADQRRDRAYSLAVSAPLRPPLQPMAAKTIAQLPVGPGWFEPKHDASGHWPSATTTGCTRSPASSATSLQASPTSPPQWRSSTTWSSTGNSWSGGPVRLRRAAGPAPLRVKAGGRSCHGRARRVAPCWPRVAAEYRTMPR